MTLGEQYMKEEDYLSTIDFGNSYSSSTVTSTISSASSNFVTEHSLLEVFEEKFQEKYKVDFEGFIKHVLKDYPELEI